MTEFKRYTLSRTKTLEFLEGLAGFALDNSASVYWPPAASPAGLETQLREIGISTEISLEGGKLAAVSGITTSFSKQQNAVTVHFSLPKAAPAEFRLYDIQGKCVQSRVTVAGPGNATVVWNLGDLADGKYLLSMKAGTYQLKKAVLIVK